MLKLLAVVAGLCYWYHLVFGTDSKDKDDLHEYYHKRPERPRPLQFEEPPPKSVIDHSGDEP